MNRSLIAELMRKIAALFVVALFFFSFDARSEEVPQLVFSVTNNTVHPGQTLWITLHAMNSGGTESTWNAPKTIAGHFVEEHRRLGLTLEANPTNKTRHFRLPPQTFSTISYKLIVPTTSALRAYVEIEDIRPATLVLNIVPDDGKEEFVAPKSKFMTYVSDVAPEGSPLSFNPTRFFKEHISGYEPLYFIAGTETPNAKFQISFKYQIFNDHGYLGSHYEELQGFHIAYTQTSLWDWNAASAPFFDSSYKPEILYSWDKVLGGKEGDKYRVGVQFGIQHESNGKGGLDSRSLNIAYIRPTFVFGGERDLQLTLQPRAWFYVGDLIDNPDLAEYRGYADLRAIIGWQRGLQISTTGRIGNNMENGSLQFDLTYPMMRFFYSNFSIYLHAQYFTGYGESLLRYDEKSSIFRLGFSLYR